MAFPQTIQDIKTEIQLDGVWTDISGDVRRDPGIKITRGTEEGNTSTPPTTCNLALDNTSGKYSPRNPMGTYYGTIGRNTPLRVSVLGEQSWLYTNQDTGTTVGTASVSTPDTAALDITGDIDIRFQADFDSWRNTQELVSKWTESGNQRSYMLSLGSTGVLRIRTSSNGTAIIQSDSTQLVPITNGLLTVRATVDVDNGASGNTVTFYTGTGGVSGSFTQLGSAVVNSGTTSIFSSSSVVYLLDNPASAIGSASIRGRVYSAQIRSSIAGTVVANPDFTIQSEGATSFADSTSKTWTVNGTPTISLRDYRFRGEVSSWPQKWDQSGSDVYTDVEAAGPLRRLGQGQTPVPSSINRTVSSLTNSVAYWSAEDGELATSLGSQFASHKPMKITGTPALHSDSSWLASDALPVLNLASFSGVVPNYTATAFVQARTYISIPDAGIANGIILMTLNCSGSARTFNLKYTTLGGLAVDAYDDQGVSILVSAATAFAVNGSPRYLALRLEDVGADIEVQIYSIDTTTKATTASSVFTIASQSLGRATAIKINPELRADEVVMGHFSVDSSFNFNTQATKDSATAWQGETAGDRIVRLTSENDIPFYPVGDMSNTEPMGPQGITTALGLIKECADADLGMLYEPRDNYGLEYRTRKTLYHQPAVLTASYAANALDSFEPVEDDQNTRNDVTVIRKNGGSFRVTDTTSALSTSSPPDGVGIYDDEVTLSLYLDDQAEPQAGFRLNLGTVDEARYPVIGFNTTSGSFQAAGLMSSLMRLDIGDRLIVTGSPSWLPPDDVQQLALGFTEHLGNFERAIDINCAPASPWDVSVYAAATSSGSNQYKYSSNGSTTNGTMTTSATSMSVATASGPVWTTSASQMPIDVIVGGERMSVTAISGTTSPQTFTVTRSVNGIVKTHAVGETVALFRPAIYGF